MVTLPGRRAPVRPVERGCLRLGRDTRQHRRAGILLHQPRADRTWVRANQRRVLRQELLSARIRGRHRTQDGAGSSTNRKGSTNNRGSLRILQEDIPSHGREGNTPDRGYRDPPGPEACRIQDLHRHYEVYEMGRRVRTETSQRNSPGRSPVDPAGPRPRWHARVLGRNG